MQPEIHIRRLLGTSDRLPAGPLERQLIDEAIVLADALGDERLGYEARRRMARSSELAAEAVTLAPMSATGCPIDDVRNDTAGANDVLESATPNTIEFELAPAWLRVARERATVGDVTGARSAIARCRDCLDAPPPPGTGRSAVARLSAELYALEIRIAVERGDYEQAERLCSWRVDVLIEDERLDLAEVELQLGLLLFGVEPQVRRGDLERALGEARRKGFDAEAQVSILTALAELKVNTGLANEAVTLLLVAVKLCGYQPDDETVQRPLYQLARARFAAHDHDGARAALDRVLRHPLDRAFRARSLLLRARALASDGSEQGVGGWFTALAQSKPTGNPDARRLLEAVTDADRALVLCLELGYSQGIIEACGVLATLLEDLGTASGVIEAWRRALTESERIRHPHTQFLRFRLARALIAAERGAEACAELMEVFAFVVEMGLPTTERSEILYWLGHAQRLADDDQAAYASWSVALSLTQPPHEPRAAVRLGLALGRLLLDDDDQAAVDVLSRALRCARLLPAGSWEVVDALHLLGQAQCAFGDRTGLDTLDEAICLAADFAFDVDGLFANITESRAHALDSLGDDDEAVRVAARATALYERVGQRSSAGHTSLFTARLLRSVGQLTEAQQWYEHSVELLSAEGAVARVADGELRIVRKQTQSAVGRASA
ncbi:hypothetical protein KPL76_04850 [Subtercola sp. PAMC28395]|uniref:hypothetical protein n=1 Tax=Subtercola sp. PAMC28395 TaxID=2846775 RepID=UPI001C0AE4A7|nr:hypothetical protein [Subtercola sp. PAMC28395]QWT24707.1 hypothetical protein KPL76_04850 [Subtercola sp. PAMC28395]